MSNTTLIVDGSNIATEGRTAPSLQQLDEAVRALIDDRHFDVIIVVVDATFGHRIDSKEAPHFEEAVLAGEIITPPAGTVGRGDAFILQVADRSDAVVFSNDSFQEFHGTYEWLFEEGRLIGGKPVPPIGWVFVDRVPVRGATSRRAVRDAGKGRSGGGRSAEKSADKAPARKRTDKPSDTSAKKTPKQTKKGTRPAIGDSRPAAPRKRRRGRGGSDSAEDSGAATSGPAPDAANDASTFLAFVSEHKIGEEIDATITDYSSHGAYADVAGTRCYLPLKLMGDPAPNSAREAVSIGDTRRCRIERFNTPRRGIDLALLDDGGTTSRQDPLAASRDLLDSSPIPQPAEEAKLAAKKKAPAKKAPAKKAPAKKAPAKKAPAKKAPAKKAPAKKAPAKKAPAKKAPAKKAPAKKAPAKKAPAKKAPAKKAPAKKAPAKKAPAKKAPAKKAPAKKAPAKKAPAKKAPAKKAPAKKAPAKKAPAKKAPAKKAPAKKAPAKKAPAKKAPAKKHRVRNEARRIEKKIKDAI